jgi:hypothetical protein
VAFITNIAESSFRNTQPFWAWGLTWNFIQHLLLWKYRMKMRTFVELERIIWRTGKIFVFGNPYSTVLAHKPRTVNAPQR